MYRSPSAHQREINKSGRATAKNTLDYDSCITKKEATKIVYAVSMFG